MSRVGVGRRFGTDALPGSVGHNQETLENVKGPGRESQWGGDRRYAWNAEEEGLGTTGARSPIWGGAAAARKPKPRPPGVQAGIGWGAAVPLARSVFLGQFLSPQGLHLLVGKRGDQRKGFY